MRFKPYCIKHIQQYIHLKKQRRGKSLVYWNEKFDEQAIYELTSEYTYDTLTANGSDEMYVIQYCRFDYTNEKGDTDKMQLIRFVDCSKLEQFITMAELELPDD